MKCLIYFCSQSVSMRGRLRNRNTCVRVCLSVLVGVGVRVGVTTAGSVWGSTQLRDTWGDTSKDQMCSSRRFTVSECQSPSDRLASLKCRAYIVSTCVHLSYALTHTNTDGSLQQIAVFLCKQPIYAGIPRRVGRLNTWPVTDHKLCFHPPHI